MQLSKTQISALLTEIASQEDGFNEILRMSFEAMMKAERQEHLIQAPDDKGNGFRQVKAYGRGKMLELRVPRTREGNFYPLLMSVLRDQEEESRKIAFELYGAGLTTAPIARSSQISSSYHHQRDSYNSLAIYKDSNQIRNNKTYQHSLGLRLGSFPLARMTRIFTGKPPQVTKPNALCGKSARSAGKNPCEICAKNPCKICAKPNLCAPPHLTINTGISTACLTAPTVVPKTRSLNVLCP